MNILYLSSEYPPETGHGGIGTYTRHMAEGLASIGHEITVIAQSVGPGESILEKNGVTIHRCPPLPYPLPAGRIAYPLRRLCTALFPHTLNRVSWSIAARRKAIDIARRAIPDIIEAPECGAEGLFINSFCGRRMVIRLHTPWAMVRKLDMIGEPAGDALVLPFLEKWTSRRAHGVTAPSRAIAGILEKDWHLRKVTVLPNPLPVHRYTARNDCDKWIYVGRIERRKGVHHLIRAYSEVRRIRRVPKLELVGNSFSASEEGGDYGNSIRRMIHNLDCAESVHWIHELPLETVADRLRDASVAFLPSLWENFPYACLEAMASGCAVVASRCGGIPEMITHGREGLLVDPDSPGSLVAAMHHLLDHHDLIGAMGTAARLRVEGTISLERVSRAAERYYMELLAR